MASPQYRKLPQIAMGPPKIKDVKCGIRSNSVYLYKEHTAECACITTSLYKCMEKVQWNPG